LLVPAYKAWVAAVVGTERRTQAERTATTRARLLDATVECLAELGYTGTTTTEVSRRAGVSRGAQLHHFPTRNELLASAVDHVFQRQLDEFQAAFSKLPEGVDRMEAAIDLLWPNFTGPTFAAWVELSVAARTDPDLAERVRGVAGRFDADVNRTFFELFPDAGSSAEMAAGAAFAFTLFEGMAFRHMHDTAPHPEVAQMLEMLKAIARLFSGGTS
jgi:AcrR family transcriptional regulator